MKNLSKVTAVVLAGCMLLPGIGASADNETAKSVVINSIDRGVTITTEEKYSHSGLCKGKRAKGYGNIYG